MNKQYPKTIAMCRQGHEIGEITNLLDLDFLALLFFFGVHLNRCVCVALDCTQHFRHQFAKIRVIALAEPAAGGAGSACQRFFG